MSCQKAILVVDDDREVQEVLASSQEARGCRIDIAGTAQQGLELIGASSYDVIITDFRVLTAVDLLRRIREVNPGAKVIVVTSESTPDNVICSIREQAFAYFSKPFSPNALTDMLAHALTVNGCEDDIELLSARPEWITLRMRSRLETADRLVHFLRELEIDMEPGERDDIATAFRELLINAIEHGAKGDPRKKLMVSYVRSSRARIYYVQDPGPGFSFTNLKHAAVANPTGNPAEHVELRSEMGMRPGGFGILLTQKIADELIYNEKGNEVIFIKYLKG